MNSHGRVDQQCIAVYLQYPATHVKPRDPIRSGDYAWFPPQPPGSLVMWGTEWPKV